MQNKSVLLGKQKKNNDGKIERKKNTQNNIKSKEIKYLIISFIIENNQNFDFTIERFYVEIDN